MRPAWAVKAIMVMIVTSIFFRCVSATNHTVGGLTGWSLISNLDAWSSTNTFHTGDFLVFRYGPTHDVLEVSLMEYATCRTINPIAAYDDGLTVLPLSDATTRYFICGRQGHCAMGVRLQIQVLAAPSPSPAPSPSIVAADAPTEDNRRSPPAIPPPSPVMDKNKSPPLIPLPKTRPPPAGGELGHKKSDGHCIDIASMEVIGWLSVLPFMLW